MRILLAVTGGIATYKAPDLVRRLRERDHEVRCLVTDNAARLVSVEALATVSGHRVRRSVWDDDGAIDHIDIARWCDCLLIAPATANSIAKLALGLADDLLGTTMLALEPSKRLVLCPAMNSVMWHKPIVQQHLATLREWGAECIGPISGDLACGETGVGAMTQPVAIAEALTAAKPQ